jgi:23S rRNA (adenine2503-C2)-methyltransferase
MTDIAKDHASVAAKPFVVGRPEVIEAQVSTTARANGCSGSDDGQDYEMVFIPDADRGTLCVSSQVGCTLNCRFCHTGTMRLVRNLTAGEIVGQVMLARDSLGEWPSQPEGRMLTNIVMMGMGEPLYNFENVRDALKLVMDGDGLALSSGGSRYPPRAWCPMMGAAGAEIGVEPRGVAPCGDERRCATRSCPLKRKYGIEELLRRMRRLSGANNARRHHLRICDAEGQKRQ